jgi:hypothetical protein
MERSRFSIRRHDGIEATIARRLSKYTQSVRFVTVLIATLACAAAPAFAGGNIYQPEKYVARYCSPSGDICLGIFRSSTVVFQLMTVERYFPRYGLCVRSPRGAKTCRTLPVNPQGSVWGSHKRWPRHFGDSGPGVYLVTWSQAGRRLGPTLRFTHR